jgi:hypothetical protein
MKNIARLLMEPEFYTYFFIVLLLALLTYLLWPTRKGIDRTDGGDKTRTYLLQIAIIVLATNWTCIVVFSKWPSSGNPALDCCVILGMIVGVVSWREALVQTRQVKAIEYSLPTRYIDAFPHHLNDIIDLIARAKQSFFMLADCADYGVFSNPEAYDEMVQAIKKVQDQNKKQKKQIMIKIRICGQPQAISRSSEFWSEWQTSDGDLQAWLGLRENRHFAKRLREFYRHNCDYIKGDPISSNFDPVTCSREECENMLLSQHKRVENYFKNDLQIDVKPLTFLDPLPGVFFWMKDNEEAVFVLSHTGGPRTQGMAFFTRDVNILRILRRVWETTVPANEGAEQTYNAFKSFSTLDNFLKLFPHTKHDLIKDFIKNHSRS